MNQRVKKLWVDALRSGEYKQGFEALRSPDDEFCCLGVLCDLYSKEKTIPWDDTNGGSYTHEGGISFPSQNVKDWADIWFVYSNILSVLVDMNDHARNSFKTIADYIEQHE